jgi:argininosuccinate lyase
VLNLPFRQAHHVTGAIVKIAAESGCELHQLTLEQMRIVEPRITDEVYSVLAVEQSIASRMSYGGTSPTLVAPRAQWWIAKLKA